MANQSSICLTIIKDNNTQYQFAVRGLFNMYVVLLHIKLLKFNYNLTTIFAHYRYIHDVFMSMSLTNKSIDGSENYIDYI